MINFVDKAIIELYSNVASVTIIGENGYEARDANNEIVTVDSATVEARAVELETEFKWETMRRKRNQLLAETDFYALSDVTMTTEMSNYRQALRDLPSSTSNPDDVVFPTKP
jgi:hypothetical protein